MFSKIIKNTTSTVTINGTTYTGSFNKIVVSNGQVLLDGKEVEPAKNYAITIEGDIENLQCDASVTVNGNVGTLVCGNSATICGNVSGNVDAGNSVNCRDISGKAKAGNGIVCNTVSNDK